MTDKEKETEMVEPEEETSEGSEQEPTLEETQSELEATRKALSKANKEAASRRKELEKYEAAEEKRKQAEMTELEKLSKERDDALMAAEAAQKSAEAKLLKATIISKAAGLNFADPSDAFALLDRSELTLAEDGSVDGLDTALKELAEAKPYMLNTDKPATKVGATNPSGGRSTGETYEQRKARLGI